MKKLFILFALIVSSQALAQPYYFSESQSNYEALSDSTTVNNGAVWSGFQTFNVPIGFSFDYMDGSFTSFDFEASGRIIFDASHYYFADLFTVSGLQDKGTSSSLSPVSYKLEGAAGSQIFKLEISNATFSGDLSSTISFQIWFYEADGTLELHMGPNTIPTPTSAFGSGPFCAVHHVSNWGPMTYAYGFTVYDDLANLQDSTFSGTGISTSTLTLDNCPAEDVVYTFSQDDPSVSVSPISFSAKSVKIYPNPTTDFIYRKVNNPDEDRVEFRKENGKLVKTMAMQEKYDISSFQNGLYIMLILDKEGKILSENRMVKN
jgi:Secretion system C-terminal sorting domain